MHNLYLYICIILCASCFIHTAHSQKVTEQSERQRPDWLANKLPIPGNNSFSYRIAEASATKLVKARYDCIIDLAEKIKQDKKISGTIHSGGSLEQASGKESSYIEFDYASKGETQRIVYSKVDEYWEHISYQNGTNEYRCYILYAVANNANEPVSFDTVTFSRKYGARGLVRSIIPGYGQLYKGSKTKGLCIMGGEVALIGGVVAFESMRSNYSKKIRQTQNADHIRSYSSKADNCATFRNICIGGAAALYVYNLIDALVANGTKRTISKKNRITFAPTTSPDYSGISLAYQF